MSTVGAVSASMLKLKVLAGNGVDRRVEVGDFAEYQRERNQTWTIGAWTYPTAAQFQVLLGKTLIETPPSALRGYDLYLFGDLAPGLNVNNNFVVGGNYISIAALSPIPLNRWSQVVGTYDGSSNANGLRLYVNGALAPSFIIRNALSATVLNAAPLVLGDQSQQHQGPFTGFMGDWFFYTQQLSAAQVALTYGRGAVPFGTQPRLNSPAFIAAMGGVTPVSFWRPRLSDLDPLVTDEMGLHNGTAINMSQSDYVTRR